MQKFEIVVQRERESLLSIEIVASCAGVHPALIEQFIECDLIEPVRTDPPHERLFDPSVIQKLRRIERLRRDLGVNLAGVAVILNMLERIEAMRRENALLHPMK